MPDELFDIVTEDDVVTHQALRSDVHAQGWWHRGVHAFLFTYDGKMLIQKRSADRKQYASLWDCSVSEHVKAGEDYVTAAQRGLWEELGLRGVTLIPRIRFRLNYGPNDNEISVLFTGTVDSASVRFDPVEIALVDYLSVAELLDWAGQDKTDLCYWFIQLLRWYMDGKSDLIPLQTDFR
jgi:16S rRNA (adenine1518-N6/adenine1519-N6)-dimethyltransferase